MNMIPLETALLAWGYSPDEVHRLCQTTTLVLTGLALVTLGIFWWSRPRQ